MRDAPRPIVRLAVGLTAAALLVTLAAWAQPPARPAVVRGAPAAAILRQAPPPGIAVADCQGNALSNRPQGWIRNHYNYCQVSAIQDVTLLTPQLQGCQEPTPAGCPLITVSLRMTVVGNASDRSRSAQVQLFFDDVHILQEDPRGDPATVDLGVTLACDPTPAGGCQVNPSGGRTAPLTDWFPRDQPRPTGSINFTVSSPPTAGSGADRIARGMIRPRLTLSNRNVPEPFTANGQAARLRFDSATYLATAQAAIFDGSFAGNAFIPIQPVFTLDMNDPTVGPFIRQSAEHIWVAQHYPARTYPAAAGKTIPTTLTRLAPSPRNTVNRETSMDACNHYWPGYRARGLQCDEYPFASTYEGAGQPFYQPFTPWGNFSVCPIAGNDNGRAGSLLGAWYSNDRILDGDSFDVRIIPTATPPTTPPCPAPTNPTATYPTGATGPGAPGVGTTGTWTPAPGSGLAGQAIYTSGNGHTVNATTTWDLSVPQGRVVDIQAYIPKGHNSAHQAHYVVTSGSDTFQASIDQSKTSNGWVHLGFAAPSPGGVIVVRLDNGGGDPSSASVVADAVRTVPTNHPSS